MLCAIREDTNTQTMLILRRYTQVTDIQIKPNPKKAVSPAVQVQAEGEKV